MQPCRQPQKEKLEDRGEANLQPTFPKKEGCHQTRKGWLIIVALQHSFCVRSHFRGPIKQEENEGSASSTNHTAAHPTLA
mmetsp:Transcript_32122/g.67003  ORF Transcript_32122/g.67003 Transcript_32122/m.67003 type:complete len:80 (-) Transcript_32122:59-298(-)